MNTPWWYALIRDWRVRMWLETLNWPTGVKVASPAQREDVPSGGAADSVPALASKAS